MDYRDYKAGLREDMFWFKAKRRLIGILLERLNTGGDAKILNVGAGTGEDIRAMKRFGEVHVIDTEPAALDMIPGGLTSDKKLSDVCRMSYPDGFFDIVLAFDVLEHIEDDRTAVREIGRVLKPGGFFVFTVPAFNFLYSSHDSALKHFRRYDKESVRILLNDMTCEDMGYWMSSLFLPLAVQRLLRRSVSGSEVRYRRLPGLVNGIFYRLLNLENSLIRRRISLPFGTTIYGIYKSRKTP